jgi:hypothetical protein
MLRFVAFRRHQATVLPSSFPLSFKPLRLRKWGKTVKKTALIAATIFVVVSAAQALADAGHLETLRSECASQLNLPAGACDCIAEKAGALSDNQQAFLAATVTKDVATAATLRMQMSIEELTAAGMFMASSAQTCSQGG